MPITSCCRKPTGSPQTTAARRYRYCAVLRVLLASAPTTISGYLNRCHHCCSTSTMSTNSTPAAIPCKPWATHGRAWRESCADDDRSLCRQQHRDGSTARRPRPVFGVGRTAPPRTGRLPVIVGGNDVDRTAKGRHLARRYEAAPTVYAPARRWTGRRVLRPPSAVEPSRLASMVNLLARADWTRSRYGPGRTSRWRRDPDDPIEVAEEIRKVILSQTRLSYSIGLSDNSLTRQIATGLAAAWHPISSPVLTGWQIHG